MSNLKIPLIFFVGLIIIYGCVDTPGVKETLFVPLMTFLGLAILISVGIFLYVCLSKITQYWKGNK